MEKEARPIEGVTNYPYFYIPNPRILVEALKPPVIEQLNEALKENEREMRLLNRREHQEQRYQKLAAEQKELQQNLRDAEITHECSTPIIDIGNFSTTENTDAYGLLRENIKLNLIVTSEEKYFSLDGNINAFNCVKSRPDEYIVLIMCDINNCITYSVASSPYKNKRTTCLTNYGNIFVLEYSSNDRISQTSRTFDGKTLQISVAWTNSLTTRLSTLQDPETIWSYDQEKKDYVKSKVDRKEEKKRNTCWRSKV